MAKLIKYMGVTYLDSKFTLTKARQSNPLITQEEFDKLRGKEAKKKDPVKDKKEAKEDVGMGKKEKF
jgi:hypothetical protein